MENYNNMIIFNGTYMNILSDVKCGYNIFGNAYIMHNEKDSPLYCTAYVDLGGIHFDNENMDLVTYDTFRNIENHFESSYPQKIPKLLYYYDTNYIHKNYNIKKNRYRDYYRKRELLIENCHNFCEDMELKYLIIKDFCMQNFGHVEIFLLREIFDIKHYLSILLCYYEEIDKYTFDINVYLYDAQNLLLVNNLQTCANDDGDVDLLDIEEAYHGYLNEYERKENGVWELRERFFDRIL